MSYEIVYSTNFVDLGNGKYLPVILTGSNNCTMYYGNREIKERYWTLFFGADGITTKEDMLKWAENLLAKHTADYEMEWFVKNGKWITGKSIYKYIENACRNAKTIEEFAEYYQPVKLSMYGYNKDLDGKRNVNTMTCRTTEEILKWFEDNKDYDMGDGYSKYYNAEFFGIKPISIKKQNEKVFDKPFLVKVGKQYLVEYSVEPLSYTTTKDRSTATIYTDKNELEINIIPALKRFTNKSIIAVSSENKEKNMPYCIKAVKGNYCGSYVKKMSSRSVFFGSENDSRKFASVKQAEKYIEEKLNGRFSGYEWAVATVG